MVEAQGPDAAGEGQPAAQELTEEEMAEQLQKAIEATWGQPIEQTPVT